MSFNYLQTDDRDDYFAQFDRKPKVEYRSLNQPDRIVMSRTRRHAAKILNEPMNSIRRVWDASEKEAEI